MAGGRTRPMGLIPVGLQVMTLANTTSQAVNSTTKSARYLMISVETTDARMRADGTVPQNATGLLIPRNDQAGALPFEMPYNGTGALRFARKGGTGTSTVTIHGFKFKGD